MNGLINTIASDKILRWGNLLSLSIICITVVYTSIIYRNLPPFLPLFNQMPWGEPRLADKPMILLPGVLALIFLFGNIIISHYFYKKIPLLARMITITSFLISLITFIFVFRITQLVV